MAGLAGAGAVKGLCSTPTYHGNDLRSIARKIIHFAIEPWLTVEVRRNDAWKRAV